MSLPKQRDAHPGLGLNVEFPTVLRELCTDYSQHTRMIPPGANGPENKFAFCEMNILS